MAKKTKTVKKKTAKKVASKKTARSAKKKAVRATKTTSGRKKRPVATANKRAAAPTSPKKKAVKQPKPKRVAQNDTAKTAAPKTGTAAKTAASKKVVAAKPIPAPVPPGSSVIRIKSNARPKRRVGGKSDGSVNHRGKAAVTPATTQDPIQFREETRRLPKTHLSAKELREFKFLLWAKRAELCGDVERLTAEAFHQAEEGSTERSVMPIHMADLGSDNWEQDFTLGLIDTERTLVHEIDEALKRIENKTYGICLATHNKISLARLRAKPWAKYCIEYARAREEGRAY